MHSYNLSQFLWRMRVNSILIRHAVIIEPLRPERFQIRTFNSTPLYILSVCEVGTSSTNHCLHCPLCQVCGSYQCPYCPFYGSTTALAPFLPLLLILILINSSSQLQTRCLRL